MITQQEREKLHSILGDRILDVIMLALEWMENDLNKFPDKQAEFGPDLVLKASEIEAIKDFLRYG